MSDSHREIFEDRIHFLEEQELVLGDFDCPGFVLDIGGGGEGVMGRIKGDQVVAIDLNRRELEEAPAGPLKIVMDATELQFLDNSFGAATAFFALMYIPEEELGRVFEEIHRVLLPGGQFLIWDTELPPRQEEGQEYVAVHLQVSIPSEKIEVGYGVRWPENGRWLITYLEPAESAGFEVLSRHQEGHLILLTLRKP